MLTQISCNDIVDRSTISSSAECNSVVILAQCVAVLLVIVSVTVSVLLRTVTRTLAVYLTGNEGGKTFENFWPLYSSIGAVHTRAHSVHRHAQLISCCAQSITNIGSEQRFSRIPRR